MVRKMPYVGTSYLAGLFLASFFQPLSSLILAAAFAAVGFSYYFILEKRKTVLLCALCAAAGLTYYAGYHLLVYQPISTLDGCKATLTGTVMDYSPSQSDYTQYQLKVGTWLNPWSVTVYCETQDCTYQDRMTVTAEWEIPKSTYSFSGMDYNKAKAIYLRAWRPETVQVAKTAFSLQRLILQYRDTMDSLIRSYLPGEEGAALVAILSGDKSGLDADTKTSLYRAGIGHMMSVSGTHLSMICSLALALLELLRVRRGFRFAVVELLGLAFAVFAGLTPSVTRSFLMITLVHCAQMFHRQGDSYTSLAWSVLILTFGFPVAVRDASFLLSVSGVFGISVVGPAFVSAMERIKKENPMRGQSVLFKIVKMLVLVLCVNLCVFPASCLFFDETSLISPITNFLLVPLCTLALLLAAVVGLTGGIAVIAFPLLLAAGVLCKLILGVCRWLGTKSFTYVSLGNPAFSLMILLTAAGLLLGWRFFRSKRMTAVIAGLSVGMMFCGVIEFRFLQKDLLTVTLLGTEKSCSLLLQRGSQVSIISLKGGSSQAASDRRYLCRYGGKSIGFLAVPSGVETAVPSYQKNLNLWKADSVYLPIDAQWAGAFPILGTDPECVLGESGQVIQLGDAVIHMDHGGNILLKYGSFSLYCASGAGESAVFLPESCSVVFQYGKGGALPARSAYYASLFPQEGAEYPASGEYGFTISARKSGEIKVRRVANGIGH